MVYCPPEKYPLKAVKDERVAFPNWRFCCIPNNDITATSLESWLVRGIIPKWPYFRLVTCYTVIYPDICSYPFFCWQGPAFFCWLNMMAFAIFLHYVFQSAANKHHPHVRRSCSHMCLPENSPKNPMVSHQFSSVNSKFTRAKLSIFRHILIHYSLVSILSSMAISGT